MSQLNTKAVDLLTVNTANEDKKRQIGEMMLGIRIDAVPAHEGERLAREGNFYPLTLNKDGRLRAELPDGTKVEPLELEVLREQTALLIEIRDLLLKIA